MERLDHSRHYRHLHHGHHTSRHKSSKESQKPAHESAQDISHSATYGSLRGPASYLESWLETQAPVAPVASLVIPTVLSAGAPGHSKNGIGSRQHRRRLSHDSSIIAPAVSRHTHARESRHVRKLEDVPLETYKTQHSKRQKPSLSNESDHGSHLAEDRRRYEKRARHKTREDKYEQNHGGATRCKPSNGETQRMDAKSRDKRTKGKSSLATAGDLMNKFSSQAIHNGRLTVGPSSVLVRLVPN